MADVADELQREQVPGARVRKRRRNPRTALACTFCRQRKARCSGEWPTCATCAIRDRPCVYPGSIPGQTIASPQLPSPGVPTPSGHEDTIPGTPPGLAKLTGLELLPSEVLRRKAILYFREHYAPTLLCFIPPQQLVEDDTGSKLPVPLLLCIIALVSRFIPDYTTGQVSPSAVGDYYADLARRELEAAYEEPSLANVQCCLILCLYEIGEGAEHRGWLRLGHAVRLAQLLQLHRQDAEPSQIDWGNPVQSKSVSFAESKRRTFWCCFCLERLLANGRDRIAAFLPEDITTRLPQSDENFIYERNVNTCKLKCSTPDSEHSHGNESILAYTIRIVNILSRVMTWNGRGGRHSDPRCPWLPEMPFAILSELLRKWKASIPDHLDYTQRNTPAIIAVGLGRPWSFMFMIYFQARAYLYREYLPFTPKIGYDPVAGPCDGPALVPSNATPPAKFWYESAASMVESANALSNLYKIMVDQDLSASAYPIPGLGLLIAASIHVMYSIFGWDSMCQVITETESRHYLQQDMESFNHLGQRWSLAIHWIRQVSLYYKLNSLTKTSWSNPECNLSAMNIKEIEDGIMNYVRQISQQDRETREVSLKATFDFDSWLALLENSVGQDLPPLGNGETSALAGSDGNATSAPFAAQGSGFSNLDGLAAMSSQADWLLDGWDGWAFDNAN